MKRSFVGSLRIGWHLSEWILQLSLGKVYLFTFVHITLFWISLGRLNDIYGDYKYTYWACGVILIIAGIYLFIGMGINYQLVAKEQKAENQQKKESKEEKPKEVIKAAESTEQRGPWGPKEEKLPFWIMDNQRSFGPKIPEKFYWIMFY